MTDPRRTADAGAQLEAVRTGDTLALARAITAIENRTILGVELDLALQDVRGRSRTMGVTGPPGAGKSSLINALIDELLPIYPRIGILTVDPSSPVTGGAVLGDRVRMSAHSANSKVFIRSLAARGHLGGVTSMTRTVINLLIAGAMDLVIVETVGTGQSEVEVAGLTDVNIVVCAPGLGDELQAIKAGILEVANVLVVNKADLPDADRTANHLKAMLHHRGHEERRSVLKVSTVKRDGLSLLVREIEAQFAAPRETGPPAAIDTRLTLADDTAALAAALVRGNSDTRLEKIIRELSLGHLSRRDAAISALRLIGGHDAAEGGQKSSATDIKKVGVHNV